MKVVAIGLGLIGGSLALEIKRLRPAATLVGLDKEVGHLEEALALGLIDHKGTGQDLDDADMVLLSIPVDALVALLPEMLDKVKDDAVVVEVGSTKKAICEVVAGHPKRRNLLATHPIAGTEFSGPSAAHIGLFRGKTNIICEVEKTAFKLQERTLALFMEMGMRMRYMNPVSHDKHIAYVSHLSHISSFMLGKTVMEKEQNERDIFDMAGSGFESTVRLAKSSPAMWAPIFRQNKENVVETLEEYIRNLEQFKQRVIEDDFEGIYQEMADTNHIKEILDGIVINTKSIQ